MAMASVEANIGLVEGVPAARLLASLLTSGDRLRQRTRRPLISRLRAAYRAATASPASTASISRANFDTL